MKAPDLSILVLLLFICCFLFYSQLKKGEFSKKNYYEQYRSMKGFVIMPVVIIILLVAIFNKLFTNS
ncbi:hypothetical protein [Flavobacterium sp.]|uniref:hypothetical protein n=1 Tax=Flavobacterium sp. TaxID=239 RepID=UPI0026291E25|nr:hypothetical protein [Flavobacterium sp.]